MVWGFFMPKENRLQSLYNGREAPCDNFVWNKVGQALACPQGECQEGMNQSRSLSSLNTKPQVSNGLGFFYA